MSAEGFPIPVPVKDKDGKPCRVCTDFKSWARSKRQDDGNGADDDSNLVPLRSDCPLDKDSLGHNSWSFLHTMACYYPEKPTERQEKEMSVFIKLFSKFYPCDHCAEDFRTEIAKCPPDTKSKFNLGQWFCKQHNLVNKKLGKEEFDCKLFTERWCDGWASGECDLTTTKQ